MKSHTRLLIVLPSASFGGAERVVFNLLQGIKAYECCLLTQSAIADAFRPLGVRMYLFDNYGCRFPYDLGPLNALHYACCIRWVARLAAPVKIIAMMHNGTFFCAIARRYLAMDATLIGSIHGNITAYFKSERRKASWWEQQVIRVALAVPDGIITPSQGVAADLIENHGARDDLIKSIPNGIDAESICEMARQPILGLRKASPWIITACRLAPQKDFMTLFRAFLIVRSKREVQLILVGDGEQRETVENMIIEMGLGDDVVMTGFQENPYKYLSMADVAVLSSFYEGSPVAIIEAFALGLPQVVTDCPSGPGELVEDGINGFLVKPGDAETMADRLLRLLDDAPLRSEMREAARLTATRYNIAAMAHQYEQYILTVSSIAPIRD